MVRLYFKHLFPSVSEWQEEPFAPWQFPEHVLLSVLPFFESPLLSEELSLKKELQCEIFMDSGAFAAAAMGYVLDPFEVAEMQAILKADYVVPLDEVIFEDDSKEEVDRKIALTIKNTQILLDNKAKASTVIAPLQGFSKEALEKMFESYRQLGLEHFALGGVVFQKNYEEALKRIALVREITRGYSLHVFGRFLHPELLKDIISLKVDSIDGFGYIVASIKGLYIKDKQYVQIQGIEQQDLANCHCKACAANTLRDFQRGDKEAQLLLIQHNIASLVKLAIHYQKNNGEIKR